MAATRITDLIVPETFVPNVLERSLNSNRFITSGLITTNPITAASLASGGLTFKINTLKNIADNAGDPNVSTDDPAVNAVPKAIATNSMVGVRLEFNDHFQAMDVATSVTGVDPVALVEAQAANFYINWRAKALGSILAGAINEANTPTLVNTSGAAYSSGGLIDTGTAWGDAFNPAEVFLVMNSRAKRQLMKAEIGSWTSPANTTVDFATYLGMPVLVDDRIVDVGSVATIYVVARGAIEFATAPVQNAVEVSRLPLAGNGGGSEIVSLRDAFSFHVVGTRWKGTPAATHPTFAELATAANWELALAPKAVGVAAYTFTF